MQLAPTTLDSSSSPAFPSLSHSRPLLPIPVMSSNQTTTQAQPSSVPDAPAPAPAGSSAAELAPRASAQTYEQWLHAIIHLPLLVGQFRHLASALDCFPKQDISVNEIFERLHSVVGRGRIRAPSGPSTLTTVDVANLQSLVRRLQDQVDNHQREHADMWPELLTVSRRDAAREQRVESRREVAPRG